MFSMSTTCPYDLLQKMDREIICEESEEPGRRNRFWLHDDVVKVLKSNKANKLLCRYKFGEDFNPSTLNNCCFPPSRIQDWFSHQNHGCLATVDAAVRLQKAYRSYRTKRRLADCAIVAEELWRQTIDFAGQSHSTISFCNSSKPKSLASKRNPISLNAARVGKRLSKDATAQKLAFQHWIEAIDPRHRYGHNLHYYYEEWLESNASQPFFYWLDVGDGKELNLKECPRSKLQQQCIKYLEPQEREHYEYIIIERKIIHKQTGDLLDTTQDSQSAKWLFVMSTSKKLYVGRKKKGVFHHSSFLAGGATLAAGRLVAEQGILKSVSPCSGHYQPTDDSLDSFICLLKENGLNLDEIQQCKANEDLDAYDEGKLNGNGTSVEGSTKSKTQELEIPDEEEEPPSPESTGFPQTETKNIYVRTQSCVLQSMRAEVPKTAILQRINSTKAAKSYQLGNQLSRNWSSGAGPRISCVADYPAELMQHALESVNLFPRSLPPPLDFRQMADLASPTASSKPHYQKDQLQASSCKLQPEQDKHKEPVIGPI